MPRFDMAALAKSRFPGVQQLRLTRAVWIMAVGAVLHCRGMFPQERTPMLCMTVVAGLVDRGLNQHGWIRRSMRVMAVGASDLAFSERHVGRAIYLGTAHLVTAETDLGLGRFPELRIVGQRRHETARADEPVLANSHVDLVASRTRQPARLVRASLPEQPNALVVALEALTILPLEVQLRIRAKAGNR